MLLIALRRVVGQRSARGFASMAVYHGSDSTEALGPRDESLVRVFLTGCNHLWGDLPAAGQAALDKGCSQAELRAAVRFMPM